MAALDRTILRVAVEELLLPRRRARLGRDQRGGGGRVRAVGGRVDGVRERHPRDGSRGAERAGLGLGRRRVGRLDGLGPVRRSAVRRSAVRRSAARSADGAVASSVAFLQALLELAGRTTQVARDLGELRRAEDHGDGHDAHDDPFVHAVATSFRLASDLARRGRTARKSTPGVMRWPRARPSVARGDPGRYARDDRASPFKSGPARPGREQPTRCARRIRRASSRARGGVPV